MLRDREEPVFWEWEKSGSRPVTAGVELVPLPADMNHSSQARRCPAGKQPRQAEGVQVRGRLPALPGPWGLLRLLWQIKWSPPLPHCSTGVLPEAACSIPKERTS